MSQRPASEFNGPGYANEPDSKDPRVVRLAAWLKSVNPNALADQFHVELAQIQIGEFTTAGLSVGLPCIDHDWISDDYCDNGGHTRYNERTGQDMYPDEPK